MMRFGAILIAAVFSAQPLPQADGPLEPSVQNEVDHAIDTGERWLEKAAPGPAGLKGLEADEIKDIAGRLGLTNGQTRVQAALALVSAQRGGGWWLTETNAAPTRVAVEILKGL